MIMTIIFIIIISWRKISAVNAGYLNLILLMWRIWWALNNASKWQMGFNSAFKELNVKTLSTT